MHTHRPNLAERPQVVLFDLDDTLTNRASAISVYARAFAADHANWLLPCTVEDVHRALVAADDFGSMRQAERLCSEPIWRAPVMPEMLFNHWSAHFGKAAKPVAGMALVLDELLFRGVKIGIVTNGGASMQRAKIEALGIAPVMSAIVISEEVGLRKPDRAIFDHALRETGCTPERAWFVGDNPKVDVEGALRAGLRAFWVETPSFAPPPPPTERIAALPELLRFL